MAKNSSLPLGDKPSEYFSMAQLFSCITMEHIKATLTATKKHDARGMGELPRKYVVWFVIALGLMPDKKSTEVFRTMVETIKSIFGPKTAVHVPAKSSFTEARQRLGKEPLIDLFRRVVRPIAERERTQNAFYKRYRLVGIDGSQFHVLDTADNEAAFGRTKTGNTPAPYPAIQTCGLVELGTRVLYDFELGPVVDPNPGQEEGNTKKKTKKGEGYGEFSLARKLLPRLTPDDLCIGDRLYGYYELFAIAAQTGAKLLWRIKSDMNLVLIKVLSDGSYLAKLCDGDYRRAKRFETVRVIEYTVGKGKTAEYYRLISNLLDPDEAPSEDLAKLYHERWEFENTLKEQKQFVDNAPSTLRSRTAALAEQELVGIFIAHFAIRSTMHDAAIKNGIDLDELSFSHSVNVILRRAAHVGLHAKEDIQDSIHDEIVEEKVEKQPHRSAPRVVKSVKRKYSVMSKAKRPRGRFGYTKASAEPIKLSMCTREESEFDPVKRVTERREPRTPVTKSDLRAAAKKAAVKKAAKQTVAPGRASSKAVSPKRATSKAAAPKRVSKNATAQKRISKKATAQGRSATSPPPPQASRRNAKSTGTAPKSTSTPKHKERISK